LQDDYGIEVLHVWGMTETSPIATLSKLQTRHFSLPKEEQLDRKLKQGRAVFGVEIGIRDDANKELPHDGTAFGDLVIRGPWIARA
jgi:3-(methylthio)propionyl---CoA ligase